MELKYLQANLVDKKLPSSSEVSLQTIRRLLFSFRKEEYPIKPYSSVLLHELLNRFGKGEVDAGEVSDILRNSSLNENNIELMVIYIESVASFLNSLSDNYAKLNKQSKGNIEKLVVKVNSIIVNLFSKINQNGIELDDKLRDMFLDISKIYIEVIQKHVSECAAKGGNIEFLNRVDSICSLIDKESSRMEEASEKSSKIANEVALDTTKGSMKIAISKVAKRDFESLLSNIDLYDEKSQIKILNKAVSVNIDTLNEFCSSDRNILELVIKYNITGFNIYKAIVQHIRRSCDRMNCNSNDIISSILNSVDTTIGWVKSILEKVANFDTIYLTFLECLSLQVKHNEIQKDIRRGYTNNIPKHIIDSTLSEIVDRKKPCIEYLLTGVLKDFYFMNNSPLSSLFEQNIDLRSELLSICDNNYDYEGDIQFNPESNQWEYSVKMINLKVAKAYYEIRNALVCNNSDGDSVNGFLDIINTINLDLSNYCFRYCHYRERELMFYYVLDKELSDDDVKEFLSYLNIRHKSSFYAPSNKIKWRSFLEKHLDRIIELLDFSVERNRKFVLGRIIPSVLPEGYFYKSMFLDYDIYNPETLIKKCISKFKDECFQEFSFLYGFFSLELYGKITSVVYDKDIYDKIIKHYN